MNFEPRRHELWNRIEAAQARNAAKLAERAAATRDGAIRLAKEHPLKLIGGAVAVGALAAMLIPKGNRRFVGRKSSALAGLAVQLATDYAASARTAMKSARAAGQETAAGLAETLMDRATGLRQEADRLTGEASDLARDIRAQVAKKVSARIRK